MYATKLDYHRPGTVDEALDLLSRLGDDAKLLAGGHSLLPLIKLRFAQPGHLIDIRHVPGLKGIREEEGAVVIGATTTHREVETSTLLHERLPVLAETAGGIGDPLVRNMGTLGGSLAHADPAADLPAVMLVLGAEVVAVGPVGSRTIPADDFFVGMLTSALEPTEVLTEVRIPLPGPGTGCAYAKFPHPASRYAVVGAAACLTVSGGTVSRARVALTGVPAVPSRASAVEAALEGADATEEAAATAARKADQGLDPRGDLQGSADYKRNLARVFTRRALIRALERAG